MFERKDADALLIAIIGAGLFLSIAFVGLFMHSHFMHLKRIEHRPPQTNANLIGERQPPPPPRLQARPRQDLEDYLKAEKERLGSYGWVDQSKGIARIPIERAMELMTNEKR